MLPIVVDVSELTIAVIGAGPQACRRLQMLDAAGARYVRVYAETASSDMRALAGDRLIEAWPTQDELAACHIIYVANVDAELEERFTAAARAVKTLVNVEDVKPLCDFHVPAIVRRGDMLLTASTGGKSPGLALRLKRKLEEQYPESWAARLDELSALRDGWRAEGADFKTLIERSNQIIDEKGWLA